MPGALGAFEAPQEDLRSIAQALEAHALPGDVVVVGYIWQQGILKSAAPELPVRYYLGWFEEASVEDELLALLQEHERLWLLAYDTERQQPDNTAGWWLEQHTARAYALDAPPYALTLYTDPQPEIEMPTSGPAIAQAEQQAAFEGGVALLETSVPEGAAAGEALSLTLTWVVTGADTPPWIVFVHLVDASGKLWAQSDGPPENGLQSFADSAMGVTIEGERAMLIPAEAPPGEYRVLVGLYDLLTGERALVVRGAPPGADYVVIDQVSIEEPEP